MYAAQSAEKGPQEIEDPNSVAPKVITPTNSVFPLPMGIFSMYRPENPAKKTKKVEFTIHA